MAAVGALGTGASFMWIVAHACAPGPKRLDHTFAASPPAIPTGEDQVAAEPAWSHIAGMESRPSVSPNLFDYASARPARAEQPQALIEMVLTGDYFGKFACAEEEGFLHAGCTNEV